jgi:hypothetical protein
MEFEYRSQLPSDFNADSRVWIYQASRPFLISESIEINSLLQKFVAQWNSHGTVVKGFASLIFSHFIILIADESATGISGCSTDSSVRMIKEIESRFNVNLFDRQMLAFAIKDKIQLLPLNQLKYAADNHFINANTIYFNNLVQTKEELDNNWMIPINASWLAKRISFPESVS